MTARILSLLLLAACLSAAYAQSPPSQVERARYTGLLLAAARGDAAQIKALIESIVLGDGGPRHVETLKALVEAGANLKIADRNGQTPLARARRYGEMVKLLERARAQ